MFQFKDLHCFVAVYESRGFGRAADVLDSTQSQVSMRIARLEKLVGASLFDRMHAGTRPTPRGEVMYRHAKRVLRELAEMEAAVSRDAA
jgi:DNA-binding transcriptional LysR family regulator